MCSRVHLLHPGKSRLLDQHDVADGEADQHAVSIVSNQAGDQSQLAELKIVEGADTLLRLRVDIGSEERTIFAGIRQCYNQRTQDPEYERLTFCLLGVATPADLKRLAGKIQFSDSRKATWLSVWSIDTP